MVQISRVHLPWRTNRYAAVVFEDLFTPNECAQLVARSERQGYEAALINVGGGRQQKMDDVRNSDRCIIDDPGTAAVIWQRVRDAASGLSAERREALVLDRVVELYREQHYTSETWNPVGLNERLRFLRYYPGTFFKPHYDGCYERGEEAGAARRGETSFFTLQLYLNNVDQGGETKFICEYDATKKVAVVPKQGAVLIFQHDLLHEGAPTLKGVKYVIRTDVMFTEKGPGHEYAKNQLFEGSESLISK